MPVEEKIITKVESLKVVSDAVTRLGKYSQQSFVFHGSPSGDITILEPRPAEDTDTSDTYNNDTAVFATHLPEAAVIFAVMSTVDIPDSIKKGQSWSVGMSKDDSRITAKIPSGWRPYIEKNNGFVYVLSGTSFDEPLGWQTKSKSEVILHDTLHVAFTDFEDLGGLLVWKD